jgi:hypothetical protein
VPRATSELLVTERVAGSPSLVQVTIRGVRNSSPR